MSVRVYRIGHPLLWFAMAGIAAVIAIPAWLQPDQRIEEQSRPVVSTAALSYTAEVPPNPVSSRVRSGDVVFLNVVDTVDASLRWELSDPMVRVREGELAVDVVLTSTAGWRRVLNSGPTVQFSGQTAEARFAIDFDRALRTAAEIDARAGVSGATSVQVQATARVQAQVPSATGAPIDVRRDESFSWEFALTPVTATPTDQAKQVAPGADAPLDADGLGSDVHTPDGDRVQERVQFVTSPVQVPNNVEFLGRVLSLTAIQSVASVSAALFLAVGLVAVAGRFLVRRRGEAAIIAAQNADRLVAVASMPAKRRAAALTVGDFAALRAMSREHGLLILVHDAGSSVEYYLVDGAVTYRYCAPGAG